jgi:hypothetical protein
MNSTALKSIDDQYQPASGPPGGLEHLLQL